MTAMTMQKGVVRSSIDLKAAWLTLMESAAGSDRALQAAVAATAKAAAVRMLVTAAAKAEVVAAAATASAVSVAGANQHTV